MLAEAARVNQGFGAQIIDLNMGCPAKKVCNKAAGSALMRDEILVGKILNAVVSATDVPVTLKMRLGWSKDELNAKNIARIAESEGVCLITVHGRTRACKFAGNVDYAAIADVVSSVDIPVVANGDIKSEIQARQVMDQTGAAAIMIGRAAQGRPWLARQVDYHLETGEFEKNPEMGEIKRLLVAHLVNLAAFYGEILGPRIARKHVGWFFESLQNSQANSVFFKNFNGICDLPGQIFAIEEIFKQYGVLMGEKMDRKLPCSIKNKNELAA